MYSFQGLAPRLLDPYPSPFSQCQAVPESLGLTPMLFVFSTCACLRKFTRDEIFIEFANIFILGDFVKSQIQICKYFLPPFLLEHPPNQNLLTTSTDSKRLGLCAFAAWLPLHTPPKTSQEDFSNNTVNPAHPRYSTAIARVFLLSLFFSMKALMLT